MADQDDSNQGSTTTVSARERLIAHATECRKARREYRARPPLPSDLADLSGADLSGADLSGADLSGADLSGAVLRGAVLRGAVLSGAVLRGAVLRGAVLRDAVLRDADLSGADLSGAVLHGAVGLPLEIPTILNIDAAILAAVESGEGKLDMGSWHTCETTHCRAGWAVTLAGEAGKKLEERIGTAAAAALIYNASAGYVPCWYSTNDDAMADMRAHAEAEASS